MVTRGSKKRPDARLPKAETPQLLDAEYWAGFSQRVKALEDKPDPVVVDKDGEVVPVPVGTIALAFVIHDIALGAILVAAYWLARGYGWHLPPGWL
jgi:hypothetical protein